MEFAHGVWHSVHGLANASTCVQLPSWPFCGCRHSAPPHPPPHRTWLRPPPLSISPSLPGVMSSRDDGAQIKSSLSRSWELSWVYFYGFFISLLPPPACVPACQGTDSWPKARSTGIHPRPRCSFEVSPRPDNRKKKMLWLLHKTIINSKYHILIIRHCAIWIWKNESEVVFPGLVWNSPSSSSLYACVCICVSWFCKLTRGCSEIDLSEQLKEDFCRICGPSDIINCTVGLRQRFLQSNSRVHPVLAVCLQ